MEKTCFVIMPIGSQKYGDTELSASELRSKYDDLIAEAIKSANPNLKVIRADDIPDPGSITDQIIDLLLNCKYVVADITYPNPNVFYELGIRHACRPGTILIKEKTDFPPPFDISHLRYIEYNNTATGLKNLSKQLKTKFNWFNTNPKKADNHVLSRLNEVEPEIKNKPIKAKEMSVPSKMKKFEPNLSSKGSPKLSDSSDVSKLMAAARTVWLTYKDYNKAIEIYDRVLSIDPYNKEAWMLMGQNLSRIKRYEEALKSFDKALEIYPDYTRALNQKADVLKELGRHKEAKDLKNYAMEIELRDAGL